jgi:branched-chain amino acid transport system ATP-binding protein
MRILEIDNLTKNFGGLTAINELDLHIEQGEILGLIGPNGAGKSTVFNCVAGVFPISGGKIRFLGEDTARLKPWDLCARGLARTFQIVKPFASKTVLENVMVGAYAHARTRKAATAKAEEVLATLRLADKRDAHAGSLTIAHLKRLEIAKALATQPKLLLLDEVMAGLRPTEVDEMITVIQDLRDTGVTILMIEHIMRAIMALSNRIVVIHFGNKIAEGLPDEIARNEDVIKAYLGDDYVVS